MAGVASAYLVGRQAARLAAPYSGVGRLFAAERIDRASLDGANFEHCTFANVSFKEASIHRSRFVHCVFIDCYFRETQLVESDFTSSKFIRCAFPKAEVRLSSFRFAAFEECLIAFDEMHPNLPREHNLREQLCTSLERAALNLLQAREASRFKEEAIRAREAHLREAVRAASSYYKQHFDGWRRVQALVELVGSQLNGQLWGYGERWGRLVRNFLITAFAFFPLIYLLIRNQLATSHGETPGVAQVFLVSVDRMLLAGNVTGVSASTALAQALFVLETAIGIVLIGLFVAMLLKWIQSR